MAQTWPSLDPELVHVWPRFSPDFARINTINCMCPNWLAKEACRGGVVVGVGIICKIWGEAGGASLDEGTSRGANWGQRSYGLELLENRSYLLMNGRKYLMHTAVSFICVCFGSANQWEVNSRGQLFPKNYLSPSGVFSLSTLSSSSVYLGHDDESRAHTSLLKHAEVCMCVQGSLAKNMLVHERFH